MPRRRRKAPGVGSTPTSDRPTTPVADTLGSRRYATRSATKGQQKRVRAPSDSSTGSSSSADQLEHEQALQKVRSLDTVKKALKSALGDIQKLSETAHAAGDGSDDSETSLQEEEDIAHKRLKALRCVAGTSVGSACSAPTVSHRALSHLRCVNAVHPWSRPWIAAWLRSQTRCRAACSAWRLTSRPPWPQHSNRWIKKRGRCFGGGECSVRSGSRLAHLCLARC